MSEQEEFILIIDDDPDLLDLMSLAFEDEGYRVLANRNGREALESIATTMPDLILLDMRMPVMNGWEFANEFRARHGRAAPIVIISAGENVGQQAEQVGADGYVSKPFEVDALLRTARATLDAADG